MASPLPWQQKNWSAIQQRIHQQRIPHALLLHGPEGTGKNQFAEALAQSLLCNQPNRTGTWEGEGCSQCPSCKLFAAESHPDFHPLQPEEGKQILAVDPVREMVGELGYTPQISQHKVVVLQPAETMNRNAANSLLKTLEEPAGESIMILVSHAPASLLPTIRSRCQQIAFPPPSQHEALRWLEQQAEVDEVSAKEIIALAEGAPFKALTLFSNDLHNHQQQMGKELVALLQGKENPIQVSLRWSKQDAAITLRWLQQWVTSLLKGQSRGEAHSAEPLRTLSLLLKSIPTQRLFLFLDQVTEAIALSTTPVNKELLFQGLLMDWSKFR